LTTQFSQKKLLQEIVPRFTENTETVQVKKLDKKHLGDKV